MTPRFESPICLLDAPMDSENDRVIVGESAITAAHTLAVREGSTVFREGDDLHNISRHDVLEY
jgi:hypothetical protein